jgi:hypothetical protein
MGIAQFFPVQKARHFGQSPHRVIFSVVTLLLTFAAGSTFAGEPATILALNPSQEKDPAPSFMQLAFGMNSLYFNLQDKQAMVFSLNVTKTDLFVPVSQIESQTNSLRGEALLQIREISRSSKPITVEAGYGQIWDDKSTLQKICSDYQDPGYAYVSAHFSF